MSDLILPQGSDMRQVSQDTNGVTITATQIDIPGHPTIVGTSVQGTPIELEVAGICALPVQVPETSPLPGSITTPDTIFRTGRGYGSEQLRADLDTIAAAESGLTSAEAGLAAAAARARLNSAMYTPTEQFNDLRWANREPRTESEARDRFDARTRLNEAGIPWSDPRIQEWIDNGLDVAMATDPTMPVRYQPPPLFSPYEIRQQQIEASRVDITGNDLRQGANEFLAAITYGPALVLWEAAHDRGDHSGADIAWAAAELGLNIVGIVPGVGALTGLAAKATVRRLAPEFWGVLSTTDDVVDAVRAGQALQDVRVTNSALDYRQKFMLDSRPSPAANAIDDAPASLPSATSPGPAMAPELHTTVPGLPAAAGSRPVHLADEFTPPPAVVSGVDSPLNQLLADEGRFALAAKNLVAQAEQVVMLEARMPVTAMAGAPGRGAAAAGDRIPERSIGPQAGHRDLAGGARGTEAVGRAGNAMPNPPRGPNGPTGPAAEIVRKPSEYEFEISHAESATMLMSTLDRNGSLQFAIANNPAAGSPLRGRELFDEMMEHFGDRVKSVQGNWFYGDNLAAFNRAIENGATESQAAKASWTAAQAARYGFTRVRLVDSQLSLDGAYMSVNVLFRR
ncbi:hypothetical protein [Nocardia sp. NPDC058666]|uniref:hypothetical protein n=1 Tax=Nocardia sp. NPDC058666 TaxID=3346587 RepID=UPI003654553C